jgi:DNA-binding CsgD family transcriptional regulator/tetratricopeptide (TPR) repeat protein
VHRARRRDRETEAKRTTLPWAVHHLVSESGRRGAAPPELNSRPLRFVFLFVVFLDVVPTVTASGRILRLAGRHPHRQDVRSFEHFSRHGGGLRQRRDKPCFAATGSEDDRNVITTGVLCREFLGRGEETAYLVDRAFGRCAAIGGGVILRGGAGIGKTRLIDEFAAIARARGARIGVSRAREYANAPYLAVEEALHELGIADVAFGAETEKSQRFAAIAAAVAETARAGPLVAIVEDLHWADGGSVELLRFLVGRLKGSQALVIATYRIEEVEADSIRAGMLASLEHDAGDAIALAPLPDAIIDRIIDAALIDIGRRVPAATRVRIRELSDGRPLFAEELLRGVLERLDRDGMYEPSVPNDIRASVHERFSSLEPSDREMLLQAAVVGRRFSAAFIGALIGRRPDDLYPSLRRARELQLIVEENDAEGDAFAFRHALTREAVYAELLRAEARAKHRRVAEELTRASVVDVAAVAEHTWRGGDPSADVWNERAGESALAVHAYADALTTFERAFEACSGAEDRARLSERVAEVLYALGETERAAAWYETTIGLHDDAGQTRRAWSLRLRRARVLVEAGRYDEGMLAAERVATSGVEADAELRFEAEVMFAGLLATIGRPADALGRLEHAASLGAQPDSGVRARYCGALAYALSLLGRAAEARTEFGEALDGARRTADGDLALRTLNNWSNLELGYGRLASARSLSAEALDIAEQTKNLHHVAVLSINVALGAVIGGELEEGRRLLTRSISIEHGMSRVRKAAVALDLRVRLLTGGLADELERCLSYLDEALLENDLTSAALLAAACAYAYAGKHMAAQAGDVAGRVTAVLDVAEPPYWVLDAASHFGEPLVRERARTLLAEIAERDGALPARGFLELADARAASRARRRDEALGHAGRAAAAFRDAGWILDEAYALEAAGRTAAAVAAFERVGAAAEVRRLTAIGTARDRRRGDATLTAREREIASLVTAGRPVRAIAERLVISERTVETHVAALYRKLGVTNRRELVELLARVTSR